MTVVHDYLRSVARRSRDGMEPYSFVPNWLDSPRPFKLYRSLPVAELPGVIDPATSARGSLRNSLSPSAGPTDEVFTVERLAAMLKDSYGYLGRRLTINANDDLDKIQSYRSAKMNRGSASGGGRYPISIYWIAGPSAGVTPGVYYYNTTRHGMQQLLAGDVSGRVAEAVGLPGGAFPETDQFLVMGLKFWQNSFKYNNFCYHAVTMDIGTLAQSWRMWARARDIDLRPALWFDEADLGALLGTEPHEEGVVGVVPLLCGAKPGPRSGETASVRHHDDERSREVLRFDLMEAVHQATMIDATSRPDGDALDSARALPPRDNALISLPAPDFGDNSFSAAVRNRTSSFGGFVARPMALGTLGTLLAAAQRGGSLDCDIPSVSAERGLDLMKLYVFVNHVAGLQPGSYEYDPGPHGLRLVKAGPRGDFLQRNYFLSNYNVEQTGAVLVPVVRAETVVDAVGARGYRLANTLTGAVAQAVYTTAAGIGIGCGAALGFDNVSYTEELELRDGEMPLLMIMVGHERIGRGAYRFDIASGEPR